MLSPSEEAALRAAIDRLARLAGVRYADVRFMESRVERLHLRDGRPEGVTTTTNRGVGVRVLGERTWGFACTPDASIDKEPVVPP